MTIEIYDSEPKIITSSLEKRTSEMFGSKQDTARGFAHTPLLLGSRPEDKESVSCYSIISKGVSDMPVPAETQDESRKWWLIVFPIAAGLLVLFCFLSLGGLFAVIAPWVILGAIQSATKRTGWQILGMITGIAFIGMGVAALLFAHASSTGSVAGIMGLIGGMWYIGVILRELVKKG